MADETTEFLLYSTPNAEVKVEVLLHCETLWLNQARIAQLTAIAYPNFILFVRS
ncbi:MAG: hypothetical protein QS721_10330 [Candidatus Endonucleobacter sp. (ex Gigantidas childressi)]|nr:hypothetical protein [Candidatus Endonucleobacter sp. (ex Gigantidas childressi)]